MHAPLGCAIAIGGLVLVLCASACYGSPLDGKPLDEHGRLTRLRLMHIPKTGTSFVITLRNYLTSCAVKDVTCPGYSGGNNKDLRLYDNKREASCNRTLVTAESPRN